MQILTLEQITNHIKRTGYPCWQLSIVRNFNQMPVMNYYGEDFADNDSEEKRCAKAIQHLQALVADFPNDTVFTIELKSNAKATNLTKLGPFTFALEPPQPQQPQQNGGFNGFGAVPPGFVSEAYLNGKLAEVQAESKKQLDEAIFTMREREFNDKCKRIEERLAEKERELKDEEKKYNTGTGQAADALYLAIKKVVTELIPGLHPTAAQQTLGDPDPEPQPQPQNEEIKDPGKAAAVNKLANLLYESDKININGIEQLTQSINAKLNEQNGFYHNDTSNPESDNAGAGTDTENF